MGLYSHTTRAEGLVLTGAGSSSDIFNTDHQNHVTHTEPSSIDSWENTQAHMDRETDPSPSGVPSLPASMAAELERLRFAVSSLKKYISSGSVPPHWYTAMGAFSAFVSLPTVAVRMERTAAFGIPSGVNTLMTWDTTTYATVSTMATTAGLRAPVAGVYIVGACLALGDGVSTGPSGDFRITLLRNTLALGSDQLHSGAVQMPKALTAETVAHFAAGDVLKLQMFQSSGTTKSPVSDADALPAIWMALVGR